MSANTLHYRGDVVAEVLSGPPLGPDTGGAFYIPVEADYDAETDRTTAKFRPTSREKANEMWLNQTVRAPR